MAAPPRRQPGRGLLPAIGVLLVLGVVVFGGYLTAGALSQPAGPPLTVGGVIRVSPLSGWEVAERFRTPPGIRLTRGSGNLDVVAFLPFRGDVTDLAREYVSQFLEPQAERLRVSPTPQAVRLRSGLSGVRIAYVGSFKGVQFPIEGGITAVVSLSGVGAVFDGWAPAGVLQYVSGDIQAIIDTARIR